MPAHTSVILTSLALASLVWGFQPASKPAFNTGSLAVSQQTAFVPSDNQIFHRGSGRREPSLSPNISSSAV